MILRIQIPDEVYERLGESPKRVKEILNAAASSTDDVAMTLTGPQVNELQGLMGAFTDGEDLIRRIKSYGTIKVQGREFVLNKSQLARLKRRAFSRHRNGEPRHEGESTPEQTKKMLNRFLANELDTVLKRYLLG